MTEILDCKEFEELSVQVASLLKDGELQIDERIARKGYLTAAVGDGRIVLRTTKFVGTIPLTPSISVRVKPRAPISSLSYMLVRSGTLPKAISGFARGYLPHFVVTRNVEQVFGPTLVSGLQIIVKRGIEKEYLSVSPGAPWRGRLLATETVKRHGAKGIRYRQEFHQKTLSASTLQNIALKAALIQVRNWYRRFDRRSSTLRDANAMLRQLMRVKEWDGPRPELLSSLKMKLLVPSTSRPYYQVPLWAAFAVLEGALPDISSVGSVRLESLIVDVSMVFEAFVRRELEERLGALGYLVEDGNKTPSHFFAEGDEFVVKPDIVVRREGKPILVLDAKYKRKPTEQDRYELLAFMDALGVAIGGFVCPVHGVETSRLMGETASGKVMFSLRFDLSAVDLDHEAKRLVANVARMVSGSSNSG